MTQNLTKNFIDLSGWGFGSNRSAELAFNHAESSFDIRPLVIMLQESIPIEVVEVPHLIPQTVKLFATLTTFGIAFEWDIWGSIYGLNCMKTITARVCLVSRYFIDIECLSSCVDQLGKLGSISRFSWGYFNTSNNMGFNTAHQMSFDPLGFTSFLTPFLVKPSVVGSGCEARRINGKVSFNGFQRTGTLLNQGFQKWGQFRVFQIAGIAGKGRGFSNQFLCFRFPQVGS